MPDSPSKVAIALETNGLGGLSSFSLADRLEHVLASKLAGASVHGSNAALDD
jgi:hypothetical protein